MNVLERLGGRTTHGLFTRVAERLVAMAAGIWRNWATGAKAKPAWYLGGVGLDRW